jgi:hypothetical protein
MPGTLGKENRPVGSEKDGATFRGAGFAALWI